MGDNMSAREAAMRAYYNMPEQAGYTRKIRDSGVDIGNPYYGYGGTNAVSIGANGLSIGEQQVISKMRAAQGGNPLGDPGRGYGNTNVVGGFGEADVKQNPLSLQRGSVLGFDSVSTIAGATTSTLTSRPQRVFRPERFIVTGATSQNFNMNNIRVGNDPQPCSTDAFPADAFDPDAWGALLRMDTATPALNVVLDVANITAATASRFRAMFTGTSLQAA